MASAYYNRHDASMRLNNSICLWEKEPVFVSFDIPREDVSDYAVYISSFKKGPGRPREVNYVDDRFDYDAFPLGYINLGANAGLSYLTRLPTRRQKQGLQQGSIHSTEKGRAHHLGKDWWLTTEFHQCIVGDYPSFHTAQKAMRDGTAGIAINRHVGFDFQEHDVYAIMYRNRMVGHYMPNTKQSILFNTPSTSVFVSIMDKMGLDSVLYGSGG